MPDTDSSAIINTADAEAKAEQDFLDSVSSVYSDARGLHVNFKDEDESPARTQTTESDSGGTTEIPSQVAPTDSSLAELEALGLDRPPEGKDPYKHVQSFASKKANALKQSESENSALKESLRQFQEYVNQVQPYLQAYQQQNVGVNQQQDQEPLDPAELINDRQKFRQFATGTLAPDMRDIVMEVLNSDPRMKTLAEGIDLNQAILASGGMDKFKTIQPTVEAIRAKFPSVKTWTQAAELANLLYTAKQTEGEAGPTATSTPAPSTPPLTQPESKGTGKQMDREDFEKRANSLRQNTGVAPTSMRPGPDARSEEEKLWELTKSVFEEHRKRIS